jgi:hypothetical protein
MKEPANSTDLPGKMIRTLIQTVYTLGTQQMPEMKSNVLHDVHLDSRPNLGSFAANGVAHP